MDERKMKKTIRHFNLSLLSLWVCVYVCVCVWCVQGRPCVCEVEGGGCLFSVTVRRVEGGRGRRERQTNMACRIVFTLWPESDGNRTCHFLTECSKYTVYGECTTTNTADPSHIYNSSRPGETSVSARRTQDLLCVCCSICVSLSP